jgi:hypothetical protein
MFTDTTLIIINATCILFLLLMLFTLATATQLKGGAGWAAIVIVTTTVPVYLSNLMRDLASDNHLLFLYPAFSLTFCASPRSGFSPAANSTNPFISPSATFSTLSLPLFRLAQTSYITLH